MTVDPALSLTLSWGMALLLAVAALHKLLDWAGFRSALAGYGLLPAPLIACAAAVLIALEGTLAVALIARASAAGPAAAALLTLYALVMATALLRGRRLADCGCGTRPRPLSWALVVRNLLLAPAALAIALPQSGRSLTWLDACTAVAASVALAALYGAADALLAAAPRSAEAA